MKTLNHVTILWKWFHNRVLKVLYEKVLHVFYNTIFMPDCRRISTSHTKSGLPRFCGGYVLLGPTRGKVCFSTFLRVDSLFLDGDVLFTNRSKVRCGKDGSSRRVTSSLVIRMKDCIFRRSGVLFWILTVSCLLPRNSGTRGRRVKGWLFCSRASREKRPQTAGH